MWKLNTLLNKQWIKEEVTREIRKYIGMNENKNTTYQNLWDEHGGIEGRALTPS